MDAQLARIYKAVRERNAIWLLTADHGNCEQMWDPVHQVAHTSHTLNQVEVIVVGPKFAAGRTKLRAGGRLADIAPTILDLMALPKPAEMTGQSLIVSA